MAAPVLGKVSYEPIKAVRLLGGLGFPAMGRELEAATQTFKEGVPLCLVSGYLAECDFGAVDIIYGFSSERGHNLTASGTAQELSEGNPQNQASGVITPVGAWIRDGRCGYYAADGRSVFSAALKSGEVFTQALMISGTYYGLTKDGTTGFWYVDPTDTSGDNAVCELLGLDPSTPNTAADGARVYFKVKAAARHFS